MLGSERKNFQRTPSKEESGFPYIWDTAVQKTVRCGKLSKNTSKHVEKDVSKHIALKVAPRHLYNRMPVRTDQSTVIQESEEESVLFLH